MNSILLSVLTGIVAGTLDIIPMIIKKLPKSSIVSAFLQYLVVSVIIFHTALPGVAWWIQGALISLMMAVPIVVIVAQTEKKSVPVILANAIAWGILISLAAFYLK